MNGKMTAAVLYGKEDLKIEKVPIPRVSEGEVLVKVQVALTCGTDLKVFKRGYHARMIVPPALFGHELSGIITEVHPEATGWKIGDRVVVANSAPCGQCFYCKEGRENLCEDLLFLNGAYAESIVVPARLVQKNLLRLKPETSFRDAALVEPLACVAQGIEDAAPRPGQNVLIIGAGPIGLMFAALAREIGCSVTVAGRGEARLQKARRLGAESAIDIATGTDLTLTIQEQSRRPYDVVIEAV